MTTRCSLRVIISHDSFPMCPYSSPASTTIVCYKTETRNVKRGYSSARRVFERKEITPNLALLDLFAQGMRDITVVGDASETYHAIRIEIERELVNFPAIKANYVSSGKIDEITAQLRELKNGPLFLTTLGAVSDAHGRTLELSETVSAIVSAGSFMVFSMEDTYLYPGVLGGYVTSGAKQGRGAAMLVEKFLAGARLGEIAPIETSPNEYLFDDGELDAAGLTLPANIAAQASFVNRQPSFYETHRSAILTSLYVMAVLFVSSLVVYLLVVARKNRHIAAQARALLEVKDSLTRAQHIARMGNWDWHITQDRLYWSDGIYRLFGVDRATHQPSYQAFLQSVHPDDRQAVEQAVAAALNGQRPYDVDHRIITGDGRIRIMHESAEIVRDADGKPVRMSGTVADVTEARQADAELRRYRDHLEEVVQRRTADMEAAMQQAEAANKAKTEFLSLMSHELRTPLNAIIGYTQIIAEDLGDSAAPQLTTDLSKVTGAAKHLLSIINSVLDLSRVEAGKLELSLERFDLADVLNETEAMSSPLMQKNNNRLTTCHDGPALFLYLDRQKLKQILLNLTSNAAKFARDSEVLLTVQSDDTEHGRWVRIAVADKGIGMSESALQRLFQPFSQVDGSTTRKFDGTGLGLYLTKKFVETMGGFITAESKEGEGSTFTVCVPLECSAAAQQVTSSTADAAVAACRT